MNGDFENQIALVTGGSRGIGRAIALQLAAGGADVAISYCSRVEPADEVVAEIEKLGRRAIHMPCDVAKMEDIEAMVAKTRDELGPIDLLAHCGAISSVATHRELTLQQWTEMIDVNLNGAFRVVWAVKDEMIERGSGSMVMISSIAALRPREKQIHYASAKAGVIAMTRCCAEGFAPDGVRINCVAPGLIDTEMAYVLTPEHMKTIMAGTPMGRMGTPEEVSELACFLLSKRASFMTGQTVVASGGRCTVP